MPFVRKSLKAGDYLTSDGGPVHHIERSRPAQETRSVDPTAEHARLTARAIAALSELRKQLAARRP
jgi:hypothetical protein